MPSIDLSVDELQDLIDSLALAWVPVTATADRLEVFREQLLRRHALRERLILERVKEQP
jgi:hypothetical protein